MSARAWSRFELSAVLSLCVLAAWNSAWFLPYTAEGASVALRCARSLAEGDGLVFDPGEGGAGCSSPSWTLAAAAALAAGLDGTAFLKAAGIASVAALPLVAWWTARAVGLVGPLALLPALLCATSLDVAAWGPQGMETPFWTLLLTAWVGVVARRLEAPGSPWTALVGALLYATRPEAPLLVVPALAIEAWGAWKDRSRRKNALAWATVLAAPCFAWLGLRVAGYGDWVADAYHTKATHTFRLAPVQAYAESFFVVGAPYLAAALVAALPLVAFPGGGLGYLAAGALALQVAFVAWAGGDGMPQNRLWVPAVPTIGIVVASGARAAAVLAERSLGRAGAVGIAGLAFAIVGVQGAVHLRHESLYTRDGSPLAVPRYGQGAKTWTERVRMPWSAGGGVVASGGDATAGAGAAAVALGPDAGPLLPQTGNGSFERHDADGRPAGWTSIPPDAPGWGVDLAAPAADGGASLSVTGEALVCSPWQPVMGPVRVRGQARVQDVVAGGNPNQAAAASLRLKDAAGKQWFPLLKTWTGTAGWAPFDLLWGDVGAATEFRACVGFTGGTGTAWFDAVEAGSLASDRAAVVPVDGGFEAPTLDEAGWSAVPAEAAVVDADRPAAGKASLRVVSPGLACTDWRARVQAVRVEGRVRTAGVARGEKPWQAVGVLARSRAAADGAQPVSVLATFDETPDWAPFDASFQPAADAEAWRVCVGFNGGSGAAWFDDVKIVEVP